MNQIIALLLAGLLCLGAAGCAGNTEDTTAPVNDPAEQTDPVPMSQPLPAEEPEPETVWEVPGTARLSLLQTEYPVGTDRVTLVVENTGDGEIGYGLEFSFAKFEDGQWRRMDFTDGLVVAEVLCTVEPRAVRTMDLNWGMLSSPLDEGLYRVTGSKIWAGDSGVTDNWQMDFRVTKDAEAEPDFALAVPGQPVSATGTIPVHFINTTGADGYVQSIPHLERLGGGRPVDGGPLEGGHRLLRHAGPAARRGPGLVRGRDAALGTAGRGTVPSLLSGGPGV